MKKLAHIRLNKSGYFEKVTWYIGKRLRISYKEKVLPTEEQIQAIAHSRYKEILLTE